MRDEIRDPEGTARLEDPVKLRKNIFPFVVIAQMMEDRRCEDDIKLAVRESRLSNVSLAYSERNGVLS